MLFCSPKHFGSSRDCVFLRRSLAVSPGFEGPHAAELAFRACRRFSVQCEGSTAAARSREGEWSRGGREALRGVTPSWGSMGSWAICPCTGPGWAKQLMQGIRHLSCLAQGEEEETWQRSSRGPAGGKADVLQPLFWLFVFRKCELGF